MPLPALFRAAAASGASSSTPAASARELQPRAAAPAAAGHSVGAIVNVGGTLYVLATHAGNNELHGTAARSGNYYGTNVVDGDSSLGSWSDPALRGEFTWAGTGTRDDGRLLAEGIAVARLRLPRSTFTGFPPATLYARLTLGDGGVTYFALARNSDRDTGSGRGGMATGVYAWAAATTGEISSGQPGDRFQVDLFTNAAFSVALPLHTVNVWQPLRSDAAQQRTDARIEELARDAAGAALAAGGPDPASDLTFTPNDAADKIAGALKPGTVDAPKLDVSTPAKQRSLRDAINAEAKLQAGTGISIGAPDAGGVRTIGAAHPRPPAGGALGAEDAYGQQPLDRTHAWKMEAIQYREPHVVRLTWFPNPPNTPATYRGSADIVPGVSAVFGYVPLSQTTAANRGKFTVSTEPVSTTRTMSNLFPGKTVQRLRLQLGADLAAAQAEQPLTVPVTKDAGITDTLAMISSERLEADPTALTGGATAVAIINFLFADTVPGTGTVTGWTRAADDDIATDTLPANAEVSGVTWDGASLWVLMGYQSGATRQAVALTGGAVDTTKGISHSALAAAFPGTATLPGIAWNGRSIVIRGDDGGAKAFTVTGSRYSADDVPAGTITGTDVEGFAWDGRSYLYLDKNYGSGGRPRPGPDRQYFIRYVTDGVRDAARDVEYSALPGASSLHPVRLSQPIDVATDGRGNIYLLRGRGGTVAVSAGRIAESILRPLFPPTLDAERYQGIVVVGDTLYVGARNPNNVVVFTATVTGADHEAAYPPAEYDFRTVDQAEFRRLAREQHVKSVAPSSDGGALTVEQVAADGTPATSTIELPVRTLAVDRLPAAGTAGRQVWVKADYEVGGVSVQPAAFANTGIEGQGYGGRGWWRPSDDGWYVGQLLGDFDDLILLSDTTVIIRTGSIPGISKLHVGDHEYLLTAESGKQDVKLLGNPDEPPVDVYAITGTLPDGVWNEVWIEGATPDDQYPSAVTIKRGEYLDTGTAWAPAGFDAPRGDVEHDFEVLIREKVPGAAQTKAVAFVEDGTHASLYRAAAPFDAITSITFDGRSGQSYQNRYAVRLASDLAVGGGIPAKLKVGAYTYGLTAGTSEAGTAVFVTPVVDASERVDDSNLTRSLDLQYEDGSWAHGSGTRQVIRTLNRDSLQYAANGAPAVTHLPRWPARDQRVRLLTAYTGRGSGLLAARLTAAGDFAGWKSGSPDVGSLSGAPANGIAFFGSYLQSSTADLRNKTIWARTATAGKTPQYAWINGRRYGVTALGAGHSDYWSVNGADGSTIMAGRTYAVQFQWTGDGSKLYPDVTFDPGDYTWNGQRWGRTLRGLTSLHDGAGTSVSVTSTRTAQRGNFTPLAPAFDLDTAPDGVVWAEWEATAGTRSSTVMGFGAEAAQTYRDAGMVTISALRRLGTYAATGAVQGAAVAGTPIYNFALLGTLRLYLAKNASGELGYFFDYAPATPGGATQNLTVTSNLALIYQPFT